mgnify:CR=1 FL=1
MSVSGIYCGCPSCEGHAAPVEHRCCDCGAATIRDACTLLGAKPGEGLVTAAAGARAAHDHALVVRDAYTAERTAWGAWTRAQEVLRAATEALVEALHGQREPRAALVVADGWALEES